jgi:hypothetical protein
MSEHPGIALRLGAASELGEHGEHLVRIERIAQRPFDILPKGVDVVALCSLTHTTLIAVRLTSRNADVAVFRSAVIRT